jgi:hypothetical protein
MARETPVSKPGTNPAIEAVSPPVAAPAEAPPPSATPAPHPLGIRFLADQWPYPEHAGKWLLLFELRYEDAGLLYHELLRCKDNSLEAFADRVFKPGWTGDYTTEAGVEFLKRILDTFKWQELIAWHDPSTDS